MPIETMGHPRFPIEWWGHMPTIEYDGATIGPKGNKFWNDKIGPDPN